MLVDIMEIGDLKRLPLGTDYNHVVAAVHGILARCPPGTELVIDGTGIGKAVADMYKWQGIAPWCVTATAGLEQSIDQGQRTASVPKLMLVSRLQAILFGGQLKVHADIPEATVFLEELRDFRVEYSASGNMTYNAKSGRHDDYIAAGGVAAWRLFDGAGGAWGAPTEALAAMALGMRPTRFPDRYVIGVDLGKTGDHTAIVVARCTQSKRHVEPQVRLGPPPDEPPSEDGSPTMRVPLPPAERGPGVDQLNAEFRDALRGRIPTARERDEHEARLREAAARWGGVSEQYVARQAVLTARTPEHPDISGPPPERIRSEFAKGSLEWAAQQNER
jgi:hypothetical protein